MGLAQASMNPFSLVCKFLTMSTEFDKNFSKWSYCWSQKLHRKDFWTFSVKVIRPSKIKIWWLHFRNKTFFKLKLSKKVFTKVGPLNWYSPMKFCLWKILIIFDIEQWLWKSEFCNLAGLIKRIYSEKATKYLNFNVDQKCSKKCSKPFLWSGEY